MELGHLDKHFSVTQKKTPQIKNLVFFFLNPKDGYNQGLFSKIGVFFSIFEKKSTGGLPNTPLVVRLIK